MPTAVLPTIICVCLVFAFLVARIKVKQSIARTIGVGIETLAGGSDEKPYEAESISDYIEEAYKGEYVDASRREDTRERLRNVYETSKRLYKFARLLCIDDSGLFDFIYDYEHIDGIAKLHNEEYVKQKLEENKTFFDTVLKYPLDEQQRRAIVLEECSCLVISSAGSGKTSTIVGKVEYLTKSRRSRQRTSY